MKEKRKKTTTNKQTKAEKNKGNGCHSERVRGKLFYYTFKLGVLQLICKSSLILKLKLNLELALSITFRERELFESKLVVVECRCLKI